MQKKKRIALITTWFPPQQGIATNRMVAFAEYLSEDYELEVFGLADKACSSTWKNGVNVHYEPSGKLLNKLKSSRQDGPLKHKFKTLLRIIIGKFIKKPMNGWHKKTTAKLFQRHKEKPFDIIISSYSPQEAHFVAMDFRKQFSDIPWIADMRDEMSFNPNQSQAVNEYMRGVELEVNRYASAVTSVSGPIVELYKEHLPDVPIAEVVRNGFNHNMTFEKVPDPNPDAAFKFGYFGIFYGVNKPDNFFRALVELPEYTNYEFHLYGAYANFSIPNILKDKVFIHPELPYEDAIRAMNSMDANVVVSPISTRKGVYTGKLFDYISARKPVLMLGNEEDVAGQLVYNMKCGYVSDNNDIEGIKKGIVALLNDKKNGISHIASPEDIATLHRSHGVKKLKEVIERILS